jgi:hypothetical protein
MHATRVHTQPHKAHTTTEHARISETYFRNRPYCGDRLNCDWLCVHSLIAHHSNRACPMDMISAAVGASWMVDPTSSPAAWNVSQSIVLPHVMVTCLLVAYTLLLPMETVNIDLLCRSHGPLTSKYGSPASGRIPGRNCRVGRGSTLKRRVRSHANGGFASNPHAVQAGACVRSCGKLNQTSQTKNKHRQELFQ